MSQGDRIFDGMAERFLQNVYGTYKGDLRLAQIWHDLQLGWPALDGPAQSVLEVGGGVGQLSCRLAALGHAVVLTEPSNEMLALARSHWQQEGQSARFVACRWQDLEAAGIQPADLVICHAVLEWLVDPQAAIIDLMRWVRPGGYLSLLFYNRHATAWTQLMRGRWKLVLEDRLAGHGRSLNPINPLDPEAVIGWTRAAGWQIERHSGVRCVIDHLSDQVLSRGDERREILETEIYLSTREPFRSLARYVHLVCRRP